MEPGLVVAILALPLAIGVLFYFWPIAMLFLSGVVVIYAGVFTAIGLAPASALGVASFSTGLVMIQSGLMLMAVAGSLAAILKALRNPPYFNPRERL